MSQKLIMPVNKATITATYKNKKYYQRFGFVHYGIDMIGQPNIWSCGEGIVTLTGISYTYGNFASIIYPSVSGVDEPFLLANFYHLSHVAVAPGQVVTKDTLVGTMGCSGKYVNGIHLHFEVIPYTLLKPLQSYTSPEALPNNIKINPVYILHLKKSAPDSQSVSYTNDGYCDIVDIPLF